MCVGGLFDLGMSLNHIYLKKEGECVLGRFFDFYRPYKTLFILDFSCAVFVALLELGFPLAVNYVVDKLLPLGEWRPILLACAGLLAVYIVNTALQFIINYWGHMLGINIETDMRRKLFEHMQKLSFRFFDNNKTGSLMSRVTNDLNEIGEMAHHGPEDLFIAVMTLIGAFTLMSFIHMDLAIIIFIMIPLLIWLSIYFNKKMTKAFESLYSSIGDFNSRIENTIGGIRVVQAFSNEEYEKSRFNKDNGRFRAAKLMAYKIMSKGLSVSYMLTRLVQLVVLLSGAFYVIRGELTYGEFIGFILLSNVFFRPIEKINAIIESYPKGIAGFKRYVELMDTDPEVADRAGAADVDHLHGDIRYRGVSFGYGGKENVLRQIDLDIRAGETVAFVGPSGAGKTTICSLLPRFYDVTDGSISIDGTDIRDMTLSSLRRQIGIVQQEVFLFAGTIRDNIAYGKLDASEKEIWEAARRAQLTEFIHSQPDGMETMIGERGVKLSGGQKQRLAIARMFLKNPPILILDEATSALDTETEAAIQESLAELSVGRTTLVIAHRLATIKNADRIIVVTEQGITEQGSHQELIEAGGVYHRLHTAQFGT